MSSSLGYSEQKVWTGAPEIMDERQSRGKGQVCILPTVSIGEKLLGFLSEQSPGGGGLCFIYLKIFTNSKLVCHMFQVQMLP